MYQLNGYPARDRCSKGKVGCKHNVFQTDILSAVRVVLRADGCQVYVRYDQEPTYAETLYMQRS